MQRDGLFDAIVNQPMGLCAEKTAKEYGISREDQDSYALESYRKAQDAWKVRFNNFKLASGIFSVRFENGC